MGEPGLFMEGLRVDVDQCVVPTVSMTFANVACTDLRGGQTARTPAAAMTLRLPGRTSFVLASRLVDVNIAKLQARCF